MIRWESALPLQPRWNCRSQTERGLSELSQRSLQIFRLRLFDDPRAWVPRRLDHTLAISRRLVTFLVAESGLGKSVACYRALQEHIAEEGYGLVLPHELVAGASTLDQAVTETLRHLHPALAQGQSPLTFCSSTRPLLVIVEDINRSGQPHRLAEKIASWASGAGDGKSTAVGPWRLICPVWPQALASMGDQARRLMQPMLVFPEPLTPAEGRDAVLARAALAERSMSQLTADSISTALGHDPLLIALYDIDAAPQPHRILDQFFENALRRAQEASSELTADLRSSLMDLAAQMLHHRRVDLSWCDVDGWNFRPEVLQRLKRIAQAEEVLRFSGPSTDLRLLFRHDRVRDWLLTEAASEMDATGVLADEIVAEPFFAEVLASVVARRKAPPGLIDRLQQLNPLALFQSLRLIPQGVSTERDPIVQAIEAWLSDPSARSTANLHLRWEALATLAETDGAEVPHLVRLFPGKVSHGQLARLHNGDLSGGIEICVAVEFGTGASFRDRQIAHAKLKFGAQLIQAMDETLRCSDLSAVDRSGLLQLAGHLGEPALGTAVSICWQNDETREQRLREYLWAFARSCDDKTASHYLDPICATWAALPDKGEKENDSSPRDNLGRVCKGWRIGVVRPMWAR